MRPGTVVIVRFEGASETKRRPAVVISTERYNNERRDGIVALITSNVERATTGSDFVISSWAEAGLDRPSAVRCFIQTYPLAQMRPVGILSNTDFASLTDRLRWSIAV